MSKMKKLFAMLLTLVMIMGIGTTTMAAPTKISLNGNEPSNTDKGVVTIQGIDGNPTVALYQIATADYDSDGKGFIGYIWADHYNNVNYDDNPNNDIPKVYTTTLFKDTTAPTAAEITTVANRILADTSDTNYLAPIDTIANETLNDTTYTCTVAPGAYIAVITGANDGSIYNPVFLTVSYDEDGKIEQGSIDLDDEENKEKFYTYGTNAVAKKSKASIEKTIEDGTKKDGEKDTVTVGDYVEYKLDVKVPSYPKDAVNKTFFVSDTMTEGLSFDYDSLKLKLGSDDNAAEIQINDDNQFKIADKVIATATQTTDNQGKVNGFNIVFTYDNLITNPDTGATYPDIDVTYGAYVNAKAVVGVTGNPNTATLYYTHTPNQGSTHTTTEVPEGNDIKKKQDTATVYTYQLAFHKKGEDDDSQALEGAVFGIYSDEACTNLIEKVTTNGNGYGVSTKVKVGTYYVKELVAPTGYSLNTKVYPIPATWTTATTTNTATDTEITYTIEPNGPQVGWLDAEDKFHEMYEYDASEEGKVWPAYIKTTTSKTTTTTTTLENEGNQGTALLGETIPNTKLVSLPSTGGIGTTIFTIGGCAIMIAAAFFFFVSRRKDA